MGRLTDLPNIGPELEQKLIEIGITSRAELINAGTENVFIRLKAIDNSACINKLYAIEGAIQGIRWHGIDKGRKEELKHFINELKYL